PKGARHERRPLLRFGCPCSAAGAFSMRVVCTKKVPRSTVRRGRYEAQTSFLLRAIAPVVYFLLGLVLGITVLRLKFAFELFPVAVDLGELIITELTPLLFYFSRKLLPVAF